MSVQGIVANFVLETTESQGTGAKSLLGPSAGHNGFRDRFADGATVVYVQQQVELDGNGEIVARYYEAGLAVLAYGSPDTLTPAAIADSSNGGSAVDWGPGVKTIYSAAPGELIPVMGAPLSGLGDAGKLLKVAAGGASFDLAAQGTGGGVDADKLDGEEGSYYNPITTRGDIIVGDATPKPARLAKGANGTFLKAGATDLAWSALAAADIASGTLNIARLPTANAAQARAKSSSSVLLSPSNQADREFVSAPQTITSAGGLTLAHGLGVEPLKCGVTLICQTGQAGYSVGDRIYIGTEGYDWGGNFGMYGATIVANSTNLVIRYGSASSVFIVAHKTTGEGFQITSANWRAEFWTEA